MCITDVACLVVLSLDDLGCDVVGCAAETVEVLSALDELAHAEIDDLQTTVLRVVDEQEVVRLQILERPRGRHKKKKGGRRKDRVRAQSVSGQRKIRTRALSNLPCFLY